MRFPLEKLGEKAVAEITHQDIEEIKSAYLETEASQATIHNKLSVLRTVLYWAADKGLCQKIAFPKIPAAHYKSFVPPTNDELQVMLAVAPPHLKRIIILGAHCGVRVGKSELFKLTWDDVDFDRKILRVHGSSKNPMAQWREVPIQESLIAIFREWHEEDIKNGINLLVSFRGKPLSKIKRSWATMLRESGITRRIRPYDLRHAFATELVAAGVDINTVAKLMGHSSPMMLFNHYAFVMDKQKRNAIAALPELNLSVSQTVS